MKKIESALISCFDKTPLQPLVEYLHSQEIKIYSTGGTADYLKKINIPCTLVEDLTDYPSILGGRVKTLHPLVMGGILCRKENPKDQADVKKYNIPKIDLVVIDLYPFEQTVQNNQEDTNCIEKIDIGGVTLLRAAGKNFSYASVLCQPSQYKICIEILKNQDNMISYNQRKKFAAEAFQLVAEYDTHIAYYFNPSIVAIPAPIPNKQLRYGENPHQRSFFYGSLHTHFDQLNGKEISHNNLLDIDVVFRILNDIKTTLCFWGIIKHNNLCGAAIKENNVKAWEAALKGDPESAFGGILFSNQIVNAENANILNTIFFEIVIAPDFTDEAVAILKSKKNRIILSYKSLPVLSTLYTTALDGILVQDVDSLLEKQWEDCGGRRPNSTEKEDLKFANLICKHLKSNSIAIVKSQCLIGKGAGQTSRIDAVKQAIQKAKQFENNLQGSQLASDAFFPFDDCVRLANQHGVSGFIQPGGSIRDKDSITHCISNKLIMILTHTRHFKH